MKTQKQKERQKYREKGKYTKVNTCQGCGKNFGVEYFSHLLTDTGDWGDSALILCMKCVDATQDMTELNQFKEYQTKMNTRVGKGPIE